MGKCVSTDVFVESHRGDLVEVGEVIVEQNLFATNEINFRVDILEKNFGLVQAI